MCTCFNGETRMSICLKSCGLCGKIVVSIVYGRIAVERLSCLIVCTNNIACYEINKSAGVCISKSGVLIEAGNERASLSI